VATALRFARAGYCVALMSRTAGELEQTAREAQQAALAADPEHTRDKTPEAARDAARPRRLWPFRVTSAAKTTCAAWCGIRWMYSDVLTYWSTRQASPPWRRDGVYDPALDQVLAVNVRGVVLNDSEVWRGMIFCAGRRDDLSIFHRRRPAIHLRA